MLSPNDTSNRVLMIVILMMLSIILLGGTFFVGMQFGAYRSASHSFGRFRQAGFPPDMIREMRPETPRFGHQRHGFGGEVLSIGSGTLTVLRRDGTERVIVFDSRTKVLNQEQEGSIDDIAIGIPVIAIGEPDQEDVIHAKVLILPPWPR